MADPFEDLLNLEEDFYQEGYDAGAADGEHAGLVEGRLFGIEKGYEKALELGRLHGRALVWQARQSERPKDAAKDRINANDQDHRLNGLEGSNLLKSNRLAKHIDSLLLLAADDAIATNNSDEAVTDFDDRITRAQAKAKVIAAIVSEPLKLDISTGSSSGIEESMGLNARH